MNGNLREKTVIFDNPIVRQTGVHGMQPWDRCVIFFIMASFVLWALVFSSGCIQPTNVSPGQDTGPANPTAGISSPAAQGQVTGVPQPAGTDPTDNPGATPGDNNQAISNASLGAIYLPGSSVQKDTRDSSYDKDRRWVIVTVNDDETYTIGQIYFDPTVNAWFRVSEELPVRRAIHAVERDYPVLKGAVDWTTFPAKHGIVDQYGTTKLVW